MTKSIPVNWVYKEDFKRFVVCPKLMWLIRHRFDAQIQNWVKKNLTFLDKNMEKRFQSQFQYLPNQSIKTDLEMRAVSGIWFEEVIFKYMKNKKNMYVFQNKKGQKNNPVEKNEFTKKIINSKKFDAYYQPYFCYKNYIGKCDLVFDYGKKGLDIYEIKAVNSINTKTRKEEFTLDLLYQCWIINKLGYKIRNAYILHLNKNYHREEKLDIAELFVINDSLNLSILKQIQQKQTNFDIDITLKKTWEYLRINFDNIQTKLLDHTCQEKEHLICTHLIKKVESKYNWLQLYRLQRTKKAKFYLDNLGFEIDLENIDLNHFTLTKTQLRSVKVIQGIEKIIKEKQKVISELKKYQYPIYFYDFETVALAIPKFKKTTPWLQIPFQYSIHVLIKKPYVLEKEINIKHLDYIYLKNKDPRKEFSQNFLEDMRKFGPGTYVAYNAIFEKTILNQIIKLNNLSNWEKEKIQNIIDKTIDLMDFFKGFNIYHKDFLGSISIKKTLPALVPDSDLNYKKLKIQNGNQASASYFNYLYKLIDKDEWKESIVHLRDYCKLDSLAMLKIYEKIIQMVSKKS